MEKRMDEMETQLQSRRERDLVLAPNEYAYISDETKGNIDTYVGPFKTSLAGTDQPVRFNPTTARFERCELRAAIQTIVVAPEGFYIATKNPAAAETNAHPETGKRQSTPVLDVGRKINIAGPISFALWPAQMAVVRRGHHIRSNQYLLVRVYEETAARANWKNSVVIAKDQGAGQTLESIVSAESLETGMLIVLKGTDIRFFMPPTGIEVVADENGKLERAAVTLERLEYCLLLDENGNKRYERGPAVVFPRPTEVFHTRAKKDTQGNETTERTRKFRATELNPTSGIYVKVIADYTEIGAEYKVGDELFLTGEDTPIYFPREEHAIIKYGDQEVHYATAIPAGEARYLLNRLTSEISLVRGPRMLLPDPRTEVVAKRILDAKLCGLLYPGNSEALLYNTGLAQEAGLLVAADSPTFEDARGGGVLYGSSAIAGETSMAYAGTASRGIVGTVSNSASNRGLRERVAKGFTGDGFERKGQYTEPRTITLNTKYAGAVTTTIWTGFAMLLVRKSGERRVVEGPQTVFLEYDETPQLLELSTGKPKTTDTLFRTVFLRTKANKVSDIFEVETSDFVTLSVKVSYRVNFEGEPTKWFDVDNYVKFLCDHLRSRVRNFVRKLTVQEFYTNSEATLRDIILGTAKNAKGEREGAFFAENGMRVYDVETLGVTLNDATIQKLLIGSQREAFTHNLTLQTAQRDLDFTVANEKIKQEKNEAAAATEKQDSELRQETLKVQLALDLAKLEARAQTLAETFNVSKQDEENANTLNVLRLARTFKTEEQRLAFESRAQEARLAEIQAEVAAAVEKSKAFSPQLIEALNAFGERETVQRVAQAMAPLSILGGGKKSVMEILQELLKGTNLAKQLGGMTSTNGSYTPPPGATASAE